MKITETSLKGVFMIEPVVHGDHRGYFMETYREDIFETIAPGIKFVQDNESFTAKKGTLRGLHFQNEPMAQGKLIRVTRGAVKDVAVDMRKGSPNYLKWVAVELSEENKRQLYIPRGFAHGFVTLTDDVQFVYKVDNTYSAECDRSVCFCDPQIGVEWGEDNPILSEKDKNAPLVKDSDCNFAWEEK